MDNLTHGLLGMAVAVCVAPRESRRQAAWVGFFAGGFPDLDLLLRSADDPLFGLAMHRHFTHSLLLAPVICVAMAALVIVWKRWRKCSCNPRALMLAGIAAALSHGLCDVWTSYGTRWFWPFADTRVAWDLISVIDPLFTLPLLILVPWAVVKRSRKLSAIALGWVVCYLSLCFFQQQRVLHTAAVIAAQRGHQPENLTAKPSFGNIIVWRALYQQQGRAYVVCLRAVTDVQVLGQSDAELVDPKNVPTVPAGSLLARDIERFAHFSDNWLTWHPQQSAVLGDLRYALRPDTIEPLWGISVDVGQPEQHVDFLTFRRTRSDSWQVLWRMIRHGNVSR
jgi:inner membrane protein